MTVTEDLMDFLAEGAVAIEVYGHKVANPRRNLALWDLGVIQDKTRSLTEKYIDARVHTHTDTLSACVCNGVVSCLRWNEVMRRLELWVQVLELNEGGEFVPVEVIPAKDVRTGGVFQLRQVRVACMGVCVCKCPRMYRISVHAGSVTANSGGGAPSARFRHHAPDGRVCAQRARGQRRGAIDFTRELLSHTHTHHIFIS